MLMDTTSMLWHAGDAHLCNSGLHLAALSKAAHETSPSPPQQATWTHPLCFNGAVGVLLACVSAGSTAATGGNISCTSALTATRVDQLDVVTADDALRSSPAAAGRHA